MSRTAPCSSPHAPRPQVCGAVGRGGGSVAPVEAGGPRDGRGGALRGRRLRPDVAHGGGPARPVAAATGLLLRGHAGVHAGDPADPAAAGVPAYVDPITLHTGSAACSVWGFAFDEHGAHSVQRRGIFKMIWKAGVSTCICGGSLLCFIFAGVNELPHNFFLRSCPRVVWFNHLQGRQNKSRRTKFWCHVLALWGFFGG